MSGIELFSFNGCPYAQRSRMALIEKGLAFELIEVDLFDRPAWFAEVSPYGKVPVLRHSGGTVYESRIINEYLEEAFPEPRLLPETPIARAHARIWIDYCDSRLLPAINRLNSAADNAAQQRQARDELANCLQFINEEAFGESTRPFWQGSRPGLVDLHFAPFLERFPVYEQTAGALWPAGCARLSRWLDAMRETDSWRRTALPVSTHLALRQKMMDAIASRKAARKASGQP
ncbi:MAG: glutathione S-transferase family protein [Chromatiales bacterium]|nr:glutathione S-transferase family protein [Chromatiales bacterium]